MTSVPSDAATRASSKSFVTALVTSTALLAVEFGAFVIMKRKMGRIYSPRTYLPPPDKRANVLPSGPFKWIPGMLREPLDDVIHKNGLDAYLYLRYIRMMFFTFFVFSVFTALVIVPVYTVGIPDPVGINGLERITWVHLAGEYDTPERFSAHVAVAYLLTFFVIWLIRREMLHFVHKRHEFLGSREYSRLAQARTVLITNVPDELANEHELRQFASFVPGGVDRTWIYRDTKALNDVFEQRQQACENLESAEVNYLNMILKAWKRRLKLRKKDEEADTKETEQLPPTQELIDELVPRLQRPTHRTGMLGLFGAKVDSIDWYKVEIAQMNEKINDAREHIVKGKFLGSAFIRCNLQLGAHVLAQCVSYHEPNKMYSKYMEVNPKDIVWANLDDGVLEMRFRYVTSWLASAGLIFIWTFPSAFIGSLSNVNEVCLEFRWLQWICDAPDPIPGFIQGVLPPALLAIMFAILPFILKGLAWYECIPRYSLMQISVYRRFFLFLIFHGFIVVTLSSGIVGTIQEIIERPADTVQSLAQQLPTASNFFLTYMITQGLAGAGMALIQLFPLILHFFGKWFMGRTPRQAYTVTFQMPAAEFGLLLPRLSLLAVIGFAYSVISPLINILAMLTYATYYVAWRFLLTQVFDQPDEVETAGLYFPMAMSNLFVGLYVEQVSLGALFLLKASGVKTQFIIEAVAMLVLIIITIIAHVSIHRSYHPITAHLPMSLATQKMANRYKAERRKSGHINTDANDDIPDLFSKRGVKHLRRRIVKKSRKLEVGFEDIKNRLAGEPRASRDTAITGESYELGLLSQTKKGSRHRKAQEAQQKAAQKGEEAHMKQEEKQRQERAEEEARVAGPSLEGAPELYERRSNESRSTVASDESGRPQIAPAAEAATNLSDAGDSDADTADLDDHAFDHPSTYKEQPWIWIPSDEYGFSDFLVEELQAAKVDASNVGATVDLKRVVEVSRNPPDHDWKGGVDH